MGDEDLYVTSTSCASTWLTDTTNYTVSPSWTNATLTFCVWVADPKAETFQMY